MAASGFPGDSSPAISNNVLRTSLMSIASAFVGRWHPATGMVDRV